MNHTLRKRHARIWLILWPIIALAILFSIKWSAQNRLPNTPTTNQPTAGATP